jgi:hypothetical protein
MNGELIDDVEIVSELGHTDRAALAYFTAAQVLCNALPTAESVPLLADVEHGVLVDRIRALAGELREMAGVRGADLWRAVQ